MSVINLFDARLARLLQPLGDNMRDYREATFAAADWTAAADVLWDTMVGQLEEIIRQLPENDPEAFEAFKTWYLTNVTVGVVNIPAVSNDKLVGMLARGIVGMLATLVTLDENDDDKDVDS